MSAEQLQDQAIRDWRRGIEGDVVAVLRRELAEPWGTEGWLSPKTLRHRLEMTFDPSGEVRAACERLVRRGVLECRPRSLHYATGRQYRVKS